MLVVSPRRMSKLGEVESSLKEPRRWEEATEAADVKKKRRKSRFGIPI